MIICLRLKKNCFVEKMERCTGSTVLGQNNNNKNKIIIIIVIVSLFIKVDII